MPGTLDHATKYVIMTNNGQTTEGGACDYLPESRGHFFGWNVRFSEEKLTPLLV